jgi:hypothetical protein
MTVKIRNTLFFMLIHLNFATSQTTDSIPPGKYLIDSLEFEKLCKPEHRPEYWRVSAKNTKSSYQILDEWKSVFKKPNGFNQTGFLTIRFIVNCHAKLCCFHLYEMDKNYQPMAFDENVKTQLISFIKNINGWKSAEYEGKPLNYRYYLNFTIQNGEFKRVSP